MSAILNGRTHPGLLPTFLEDLLVELGRAQVDPVGPMPTAFDREFPQEFTFTRSIVAVKTRTEPGTATRPRKIFALWAFPKPDGSTAWHELQVPEQMRAQIATTQFSGDDLVTAVYEATRPEVESLFRAAWGIPEPTP